MMRILKLGPKHNTGYSAVTLGNDELKCLTEGCYKGRGLSGRLGQIFLKENRRMLLGVARLGLAAVVAFATGSSWAFAISEAILERDWDMVINRSWQACYAGAFSDGEGNLKKVAYRRCGPKTPKKPVVIIPGYTEPAMKYAELVGDLAQQMPDRGPWYVLDLPGQGDSDKLFDEVPAHDQRLVHLDVPERYPQALINFLQKIVLPENDNHVPDVIGHSTGALIAIVVFSKKPELAGSLVLSAPLIEPKMPVPSFFALGVSKLYCELGLCAAPVWGRNPVPLETRTFEDNISTTSRARWAASYRIAKTYPGYYSSGASWGWLHSALTLGTAAKREETSMSHRTLMLMADDDRFVEAWPSDQLCKRSARCERVFFAQSRHEILNEVDSIRDQALARIQNFLML